MTIISTLKVNASKINKVDISTVIENEASPEGFRINEVNETQVEFQLLKAKETRDNLEQAVYENEENLKQFTLTYIKDLIEMYQALYGNIIKLVEKYDVRKKLDEEE